MKNAIELARDKEIGGGAADLALLHSQELKRKKVENSILLTERDVASLKKSYMLNKAKLNELTKELDSLSPPTKAAFGKTGGGETGAIASETGAAASAPREATASAPREATASETG